MDKSERENLTTRIHPELKEKAQIQAIRERRVMADLIEDALVAYLANVKTKVS
ncbi:hypothetical protein [Stenomitos frigidus]|uniref:hypothetical protein n=1 Tax=Stenomitos frigidus TaxID=1886765 RepID=UPI0015E7A954|nr:hypothetical protein [Stenomitos frigidus]